MLTRTFWNYGLCLHLALVLVIAISAYLGILPTYCKKIPYSDLLGHAILIGFLAFFLDGVLGFRQLIPGKFGFIRVAPVIVLGFAAIEEMAQTFSPLRTASLGDFIADIIGILLCSQLAHYLSESHNIGEKQY